MAGKEVSKIYAGALLDIGTESNILSRIEEDLGSLAELITGDRDLMLFLNTPVISKDKKKKLIEKLFSDKFHAYTICFLKVLIDNERQQLLPDIHKYFVELIDKINNRQQIKVITSVRLEKSVLKNIENSISEKLKKSIIIEEAIDESILGGIIIKIDDKLIDGSIAKDLNILKNKLIESKVGSNMAYED